MDLIKSKQNYINHIALVLDASSSMDHRVRDVVKVADTQIQILAEQSKTLDQETRISVYTFSYDRDIHCLIYDKDVLRMPSISGLYKPYGATALCSATTLAVKDLALTPEKYGEHAFLIYVITDGMENDSPPQVRNNLPKLLSTLPDHWTLAALVPDANGKFLARSLGFPVDNVAVWNTSTADGFLEMGNTIRTATSDWMQARTTGVRGTKSLFNLSKVSTQDIKANLNPMTPGSYFFQPIKDVDAPLGKVRIDKFCESKFGAYAPGTALYEMTKRENIQANKKIAIFNLKDQNLYVGKSETIRSLLGLGTTGTIRVGPGDHPEYKIFIQSGSYNRNLFPGTELLVMR